MFAAAILFKFGKVSIPNRDFSWLQYPEFGTWYPQAPVSIPNRDFSWLQSVIQFGDNEVALFQSLIGILVDCNIMKIFPLSKLRPFQSLIGILVDCNLTNALNVDAWFVSIPNRDFSWLQL